MKIKRFSQTGRICFLPGFMAQEKGYHEIAYFLQQNIPGLELPVLRSDPELGLKDLRQLQKIKWDLVIGLSMGGVYATKIKSKKTFLINPGFNISEGMKLKYPEFRPGFKKLENLPDFAENIKGMIATNDKIRPITEPIFIQLYGKKNLINYPGDHVPKISELKRYIIPEIIKFMEEGEPMKIKRFSNSGFVTLYHVTKKENLPSIRKEGLKTKYFKTREENKYLGIKDTGLIYLVKDKNKLVKPIKPGGKYALVTIKIPTDVYNRMEKLEGDPEWWVAQKVPNWFETKAEALRKANPSKFGMISTEDVMKYSTPLDWASPENSVCIKEDIGPEYIIL